MRIWITCACLCALAACSTEEGDDAGPPGVDAGPPGVDAGGGTDAGPPTDAGPGTDAGTTPDAAVGADGGAPSGGFTLLTMNLWNAYLNGDWDTRRQMVADLIGARSPDAVCLQEVVQSGSIENGAAWLANATGYSDHFVQTHDAFVFQEGIGVLSRHPILATEDAQLPITDLGIAMRAILSADLDTPDGVVRVFCSHMSISTDETEKADESVAAFRFMDARRTAGAAYFGGDLNAEPDTLAMRVLRGEATHGMVSGDLVDAWTTANPSDPGFTIPSDGPDRRIDYIYAVPGSTDPLPSGVTCERVLTAPMGGVYASDHVGVLCRFSP